MAMPGTSRRGVSEHGVELRDPTARQVRGARPLAADRKMEAGLAARHPWHYQ